MKDTGMSGVLVAVAGQAGSGKSTLAAIITTRIEASRINVSSDQVPFPESIAYTNALSEAGAILAADRCARIVLCGPFHTKDARGTLMRLASATRSALLYVECSANEFVRRRRLRIRLTSGPEALTAPEAELWVNRLVSDDSLFERTLSEIPRAAQMLIDTTVGIEIWGGLAASRVELWASDASDAAPVVESQAISA